MSEDIVTTVDRILAQPEIGEGPLFTSSVMRQLRARLATAEAERDEGIAALIDQRDAARAEAARFANECDYVRGERDAFSEHADVLAQKLLDSQAEAALWRDRWEQVKAYAASGSCLDPEVAERMAALEGER